jgi:hypothetical protein
MLNGMNLKIVSLAIAIAAVGAVGVLTSMSFVQEANAQCETKGGPGGATVFKCDFSFDGTSSKCTETQTLSGNTNFNCHQRTR